LSIKPPVFEIRQFVVEFRRKNLWNIERYLVTYQPIALSEKKKHHQTMRLLLRRTPWRDKECSSAAATAAASSPLRMSSWCELGFLTLSLGSVMACCCSVDMLVGKRPTMWGRAGESIIKGDHYCNMNEEGRSEGCTGTLCMNVSSRSKRRRHERAAFYP